MHLKPILILIRIKRINHKTKKDSVISPKKSNSFSILDKLFKKTPLDTMNKLTCRAALQSFRRSHPLVKASTPTKTITILSKSVPSKENS